MEMVNIAGLMDHLMKEILFKDLDMDKEVRNGKGRLVYQDRK